MPPFNVITSNKDRTVGVVTKADGLKNVGDFRISGLKAFVRQIEEIFGEGDDGDIQIDFKLSENPKTPAYGIFASIGGHEPHVCVCGKFLTDGTPWEKAGEKTGSGATPAPSPKKE